MSCCNANLEKPCCQFGMEVNEKDLLLNVSKALSNEVRLQILEFMSMNPGCITGNLVDYLPLAQSTISQHLKVLKEAKIIRGADLQTRVIECRLRLARLVDHPAFGCASKRLRQKTLPKGPDES